MPLSNDQITHYVEAIASDENITLTELSTKDKQNILLAMAARDDLFEGENITSDAAAFEKKREAFEKLEFTADELSTPYGKRGSEKPLVNVFLEGETQGYNDKEFIALLIEAGASTNDRTETLLNTLVSSINDQDVREGYAETLTRAKADGQEAQHYAAQRKEDQAIIAEIRGIYDRHYHRAEEDEVDYTPTPTTNDIASIQTRYAIQKDLRKLREEKGDTTIDSIAETSAKEQFNIDLLSDSLTIPKLLELTPDNNRTNMEYLLTGIANGTIPESTLEAVHDKAQKHDVWKLTLDASVDYVKDKVLDGTQQGVLTNAYLAVTSAREFPQQATSSSTELSDTDVTQPIQRTTAAQNSLEALLRSSVTAKQFENAIKANNGATVNTTIDTTGNTALHLLTESISLKSGKEADNEIAAAKIRILLENGANPSSKNSNHQTADQLLPNVSMGTKVTGHTDRRTIVSDETIALVDSLKHDIVKAQHAAARKEKVASAATAINGTSTESAEGKKTVANATKALYDSFAYGVAGEKKGMFGKKGANKPVSKDVIDGMSPDALTSTYDGKSLLHAVVEGNQTGAQKLELIQNIVEALDTKTNQLVRNQALRHQSNEVPAGRLTGVSGGNTIMHKLAQQWQGYDKLGRLKTTAKEETGAIIAYLHGLDSNLGSIENAQGKSVTVDIDNGKVVSCGREIGDGASAQMEEKKTGITKVGKIGENSKPTAPRSTMTRQGSQDSLSSDASSRVSGAHDNGTVRSNGTEIGR